MASKKKTATSKAKSAVKRAAKKVTRTAKKITAKKKPAAKKAPARKPAAKPAKKMAPRRAARAVSTPPPSPEVDFREHRDVDAWIATKVQAPWKAVMAELRATVMTACPGAEEAIKWGQPVFLCNGPFAWMKPAKNYVNFGFWRGTELEDPDGILEGTGGRMRHVKVRDPENVPVAKIDALVRQAVALNLEKGDPTKR